jgi:hypothetical protein
MATPTGGSDSKNGLNMGGSKTSAVITDLKSGIAGMRQEMSLLKQETSGWVQTLNGAKDSMSKSSSGKEVAIRGNQVAPNPEFHNVPALYNPNAPATQTGGGGAMVGGGGSNFGGNQVAPGPSSGGGGGNSSTSYSGAAPGSAGSNLKSFLKENVLAGSLYAGSVINNSMYSVSDMVESQLLMQRASYFAGGGAGSAQNMMGMQTSLASRGVTSGANPAMDAMQAMVAAQDYGLTGAKNFNQNMMGIANVSNLVPGLGLEGTTRVAGLMQQGSSVNMLKGIGIQLRDDQGNMVPIDKVIDQVWEKITSDYKRATGKSGVTLEMVKIGLQPGNSLDAMLSKFFGSDPMLRNTIMNGLIYKAQGGGAISQEGVSALGGNTEAILSMNSKNAASAQLLGQFSEQGSAGFMLGNKGITKALDVLSAMNFNLSGFGDIGTDNLAFVKGFVDTLAAAGNFMVGKVIADLGTTAILDLKNQNPLAGDATVLKSAADNFTDPTIHIPGKAAGGPVNQGSPYLIGERGPELFVPSTSGTIVPNHNLSSTDTSTATSVDTGNKTYNFNINLPSANTPEVIGAIKNMIANMDIITQTGKN